MQWVINTFKDQDYKEPFLTNLITKEQFKLPGITRYRKKYREPRSGELIKHSIELSPMDEKKKEEW